MRKIIALSIMLATNILTNAQPINKSNTDVYTTSKGELAITLLGHGTLMLKFNNKIIHVDPYSAVANYDMLPKADLIILTHEHADHLDTAAINKIKTPATLLIMNGTCYDQLNIGEVLKNGGKTEFNGVPIEAVAAYNIEHKRPNGEPFHPKGVGNGYIFTFGDKKLYLAGDTENIPEMKALTNIDIAFLPMNLPYTMSCEMAADAALAFKPQYLYPYHHGGKEMLEKLQELLKNSSINIVIKNNGNDMVK